MRKGMTKKIAAGLLCVLLSASLFPQNVLATEIEPNEDAIVVEEMAERGEEAQEEIQTDEAVELESTEEETIHRRRAGRYCTG